MGEKSAHISVCFGISFVCLRAPRRAVPREKSGLQGDVWLGGVCELLQGFQLQVRWSFSNKHLLNDCLFNHLNFI